VVGELGEQVISTVGDHFANVSFAYQPVPLGTGNAAKCGVRSLQAAGYDGLIFVVAGDRLLAPGAVNKLLAALPESGSDGVFLVGSRADSPSSGRVVYDDSGQVAGIIETSEIALSQVVSALQKRIDGNGEDLACGPLLEEIHAHFANPDKAAKACGDLYSALASQDSIARAAVARLIEPSRQVTNLQLWLNNEPMSLPAHAAEDMTSDVNLSAYLFRASVLFEGLRDLMRANAQGEEFLTDCINNLAAARDDKRHPKYRITTVSVDEPGDALAYNTPEELAAVERRLRAEEREAIKIVDRPKFLHERSLRSVAQWHTLFATKAPEVEEFMTDTYGPSEEVREKKRREYLAALECYGRHHGLDERVFIVRSPGRINLMGRHVDHRGGRINVVAINDEILMVASPRDDDVIELRNSDAEAFGPASFSISQQVANLEWGDWLTCVNSPKTLSMVSNGHWENYVAW